MAAATAQFGEASMTDNVIDFASRTARRDGERRDPLDAERRNQALNIKKLESLRERYERKDEGGLLRWPTTEDRLRAARALGRLLQAEGIPLAELKKEWQSRYGSEFHIHRYMIPADLDLSKSRVFRQAAAKITTGKVKAYADRAKFIATCKKLNENESLIALFRETSLWRKSSPPPTSTAALSFEAASKVTFLLSEMCARLVRQHALDDLFARMRKTPGQWDIPTECFKPGSMACLYQSAYAGGYEDWTAAPPLPSIPLIRLHHATTSFKADILPDPSNVGQDGDTPLALIDEEVHLSVFREIRLAIGPSSDPQTIAPLLETRVYSELGIPLDASKRRIAAPLDAMSNWTLWKVNPENPARVESETGARLVRPKEPLDDFEDLYPEPICWVVDPVAGGDPIENHYVSWTEFDPDHLLHWLDRVNPGDAQPVNFLATDTNTGAQARDWATWFPRPLLAHDVERALYDGSLQAALSSAIERIGRAFNEYEFHRAARLDEQADTLVADYQSDLHEQ